MPRPLLILDLDETLMHAATQPLGRAPDFQVDAYHVYKRPYLDVFLEQMAKHFELAVWSSATTLYVEEAVEHLFPPDLVLAFVWARDRCTARMDHERQRLVYVKNLKKVKRLGYRLERILMVDDRPDMLALQYGNLVPVPPFTGDLDDDTLRLLIEYLPQLAHIDNVRRVEKRNWRQKT